MARHKLNTRIRQDQIAQATLDLIAAKGVTDVSVAAVARRVGVVPSALYRHFQSKDDMLDAVVDLVVGRLMDNVDAVCKGDRSPLERLERLLGRHIELIRENRAIPQIFLSLDFYSDRPGRRRRVHEGVHTYLSRIADLIREAQRAGQADRRVDPDAASVLFLGMIQPPAILWHLSNGAFDVREQAQRAWPLFRRAIQKEPTPDTGKAKQDRKGQSK